jgi:hypothetical protein
MSTEHSSRSVSEDAISSGTQMLENTYEPQDSLHCHHGRQPGIVVDGHGQSPYGRTRPCTY